MGREAMLLCLPLEREIGGEEALPGGGGGGRKRKKKEGKGKGKGKEKEKGRSFPHLNTAIEAIAGQFHHQQFRRFVAGDASVALHGDACAVKTTVLHETYESQI